MRIPKRLIDLLRARQTVATLPGVSVDKIAEALDATSKTITQLMLTLASFACFSLFALLSPDSSLLGAHAELTVPFAGRLSLLAFLIAGPIILVGARVYLHVYVRQLWLLDRTLDAASGVRTPTVSLFREPLLRHFTRFVLYAVTPLTMLAFAYKASGLSVFIRPMLGATVAVLVSHLYLVGRNLFRSGSIGDWVLRPVVVIGGALAAYGVAGVSVDRLHRPLALIRTDLSGRWLAGADLQGADLRDAALVGTNLQRGVLNRARMSKSDLRNANLGGANLERASLRDADLTRTDLRAARLHGADLRGANLKSSVFFDQAIEERAQSLGCDLYVWNSSLGEDMCFHARQLNWDLYESATKLIGAKMAKIDLVGADLRWVDMEGADLRKANLRAVDLRRAKLAGAKLWDVDLAGANLRATNFAGADLRGAGVRGADFSYADLTNADLRATDLEAKQLDSTVCWNEATQFPEVVRSQIKKDKLVPDEHCSDP